MNHAVTFFFIIMTGVVCVLCVELYKAVKTSNYWKEMYESEKAKQWYGGDGAFNSREKDERW